MSGKPWTPDELAYLTHHYGTMSNSTLAAHLHRSSNSVQHKAQALHLTQPRQTEHRPWTDKELAYMYKYYEKLGAVNTANKLHRSIYSVKQKATSLGLNAYINDYLSMKTLANCFQSDPLVIHRWIDKYNLPMMKIRHGQGSIYRIHADMFWSWAETHKNLIPFHKYHRYSLLPEPKWLETALQNISAPKTRTRITAYDRQTVIHMRESGESWQTIADSIGRTIDSVKHIWRQHTST